MKNIRNIIIGMLMLLCSQSAWAQTVLTGTVMDKTLNEPLIGANVYIVNAGNRSLGGSIADLNGEYRLSVPNQKGLSVVFSFVGYKTQTVKYTGQKVINITLEEEGLTLDAVEITAKKIEKNAFGQTPKEMVSASQKVSLGNIESAPVTSVTEALQGAMSNVDILTGADPGSGSSIRIRGTSSLSASNQPLFVVDGVPLPVDVADDFSFSSANSEDYGALLNLSPTDIESIEVLKDAAATAIWGSKGANGVLLIKTKGGAKGRLAFNFSSKYEWKKERDAAPMLDASQYISMVQDAIWNTVSELGSTNSKSLEYLNLLYNTDEIGFNPSYKYFNEYNQNTNWLDEIRRVGYSWDTNFSVSGGGDKADYRFSLGYLDEEGTTIGTGYQRFSTALNVNYKFSNKLDVGIRYNFTRGVIDESYVDGTDQLKKASVRSQAQNRMPNMSPYTIGPDGQRTSEYFTPYSYFQGTLEDDKIFNPVALANDALNRKTATNSRIVFNLHYKFLQGLDYFGTVGFNANFTRQNRFLPQSVTGVSYLDGEGSSNSFSNVATNLGSDVLYLTTENRLVYNTKITDDHKFIVTGVFQTSDKTSSSFAGTTKHNAAPGISDITGGGIASNGGDQKPASGRSITRDVSATINAHYTLFGKYLFNGGYRFEASSSMAAKGRWGAFPTVGAAWQLGDEQFIQKLKVISMAKVRFSWGQVGNTPSGASPYIGTFTAESTNYGNMSVIRPDKIQLDNLKFETITQTNLGLDMGFWEDRLNFSFDLYNKVTSDMLQTKVTVPASTGINGGKVAFYNSGKMTNKGWEFRVDYDIIRNKTWGLSFNFNIAQNRNEITEMMENKKDENYSFKNEAYAYRVMIGDPLGSFYGYKYQGVYQNVDETYARDTRGEKIYDINGKPVIMKNKDVTVRPGDAKYQDLNGDGVIDANDITYIGNCNPTVTGGFGLTFRYKTFSLIANFHGRAGQKVINQARMNLENMYGKNNQSEAVLKRWRHEGDDTEIPRALYNYGYNYLGSDRFVEDASFLRLKTVTLKYQLPSRLLKKSRINMVEVYLTGYDLFCLTNYKGQDPEVNLSFVDGTMQQVAIDKNSTPKALRFAVGFNLKF